MPHRWHWARGWGASILSIAMLASIGRAQTPPTTAPTPPSSPTTAPASTVAARCLDEARRIVAAAKSPSHYVHETYVDEATGEYDMDCSGLCDHLLQVVSPEHLNQLAFVPSEGRPLAADFFNAFAAAPTFPRPGALWQRIDEVADIKPGDFLALKRLNYKPGDSTGHVMIACAAPRKEGENIWDVDVIDSVMVRHEDDTRPPSGNGVGTGWCQIRSDAKGLIQAYRPNRSAEWRTDLAIAGRPVPEASDGSAAWINPRPGTVRVALYDDAGAESHESGATHDCLRECSDISFRHVCAQEIRAGILRQFDVVVFPGGLGKNEASCLNEIGRGAVKTFVADGGGYVGFCAGSYLACTYHPWSLGILNADAFDKEHWGRGHGDVLIRLNDQGRALLGVHEELVKILYWQGPLMFPGDRKDVAPMTVLATYETEVDRNGTPAGVMQGTIAIACGEYGKGRVWCFSPHPEETKGLHDFVHRAVLWTAGRIPSAER